LPIFEVPRAANEAAGGHDEKHDEADAKDSKLSFLQIRCSNTFPIIFAQFLRKSTKKRAGAARPALSSFATVLAKKMINVVA
jgi:hypothetical protein